MICICEELDESKYCLSGKVAIIENKEAVLKAFGLKNEQWLNIWDIDDRLLTLFFTSMDPAYDGFIVVFDYQKFCSDQEIREAIIWHEIGHIHYPVAANQLNLDNEIQCDDLAITRGHKEGIKRVLELTLKMARSLNNDLLAKMTSERKMRLSG